MNVTKKIYGIIFTWLVITVAVFYFILPRLANSLIALQKSHQSQIAQYNDLQAQIQSLYAMQQDLDQLSKASVKPDDLFTSDVQLVNEIQHIESIAKSTGNDLKISITGTAKDAQPYRSYSKLYAVPYTISLTGPFPATLAFLHYFENSYFVSPPTAIDISNQLALAQGQVKTTILANFFIHYDPANPDNKDNNGQIQIKP